MVCHPVWRPSSCASLMAWKYGMRAEVGPLKMVRPPRCSSSSSSNAWATNRAGGDSALGGGRQWHVVVQAWLPGGAMQLF